MNIISTYLLVWLVVGFFWYMNPPLGPPSCSKSPFFLSLFFLPIYGYVNKIGHITIPKLANNIIDTSKMPENHHNIRYF